MCIRDRDIPGTYSLMAHSAEEEVARNFLCFGESDAVVVVCDATCLERNLNLVLQTLEISGNVLVCVNLMDEAARKPVSYTHLQTGGILLCGGKGVGTGGRYSLYNVILKGGPGNQGHITRSGVVLRVI